MAKKEYKSFEEKVLENVSPTLQGGARMAGDFLHGAYAGAVGFLRVPTTVRKAINRQSFYDNFLLKEKSGIRGVPRIFGLISPLLPIVVYSLFASSPKERPELLTQIFEAIPPSTVLPIYAVTNFVSLVFELGRLPQSKTEYNEKKHGYIEEDKTSNNDNSGRSKSAGQLEKSVS